MDQTEHCRSDKLALLAPRRTLETRFSSKFIQFDQLDLPNLVRSVVLVGLVEPPREVRVDVGDPILRLRRRVALGAPEGLGAERGVAEGPCTTFISLGCPSVHW